MEDIIFIKDLEILTTIGVFAWEQEKQQRLLINLEFYSDFSLASSSDDIADTVSYATVCEAIEDYCKTAKHKLLEHLANALSNLLVKQFKIKKFTLEINKNALLNTAAVGVRIKRDFTAIY